MGEIYIGPLGLDDTDKDIQDFFISLGVTVSDVELKRDPTTGRSRRFAFASTEDAPTTISLSNGKELNGRKVVVCLRS